MAVKSIFMNHQANKIINLQPFFQKLNLTLPDFEVIETPAMYPHKDKVEDNWIYYTAAAFKILKSQAIPVEKIALIGIGSGVEGIAALNIFQPSIQSLAIVDTEHDIVSGAMSNLRLLIKQTGVELTALVGSLAEPLKVLPFKLDLIYGNIPNLPAADGKLLASGADKGTFMRPELFNKYLPPRQYIKWALGTQYAYLQSGSSILSKGGSILTELGGRVPFSIIKQLFTDCNLEFTEILVGFKEQAEALADFEGYHKFEKLYAVEFDFYLLDESKAAMAKYGVGNPTSAISGEKLKSLLEPFKVNAGQALELFHRGILVGHTVHIFRGQRL